MLFNFALSFTFCHFSRLLVDAWHKSALRRVSFGVALRGCVQVKRLNRHLLRYLTIVHRLSRLFLYNLSVNNFGRKISLLLCALLLTLFKNSAWHRVHFRSLHLNKFFLLALKALFFLHLLFLFVAFLIFKEPVYDSILNVINVSFVPVVA